MSSAFIQGSSDNIILQPSTLSLKDTLQVSLTLAYSSLSSFSWHHGYHRHY